MPFLIVDVRHDPVFQTSPPYRVVMAWCEAEGIPLITGWTLTVWDETPVRAVLDVIDLDEAGEWIRDEDGVPVTHPVTYSPSTLPPLAGGYIARGDSTSP